MRDMHCQVMASLGKLDLRMKLKWPDHEDCAHPLMMSGVCLATPWQLEPKVTHLQMPVLMSVVQYEGMHAGANK